ncbi:hypothetical protein ACF052_04835 [Streptomyces pilosus]|uniref:hypothetical protein n=1 Tax=Streptomyces pilosus TaxID=28893 RepID=UPI0036F8C828
MASSPSGRARNGHTILGGLFKHLASARDEEPLTYLLVRAVFDPDLMEFDARAAATVIPPEYLWRPGTRTEAVDCLDANRLEPDQCDYLNQIVLACAVDGRVDLLVHPLVAVGISGSTGLWTLSATSMRSLPLSFSTSREESADSAPPRHWPPVTSAP